MIEKFSEAFRLFRQNLWLFTTIILTVWLPGNILSHCVDHYLEGVNDCICCSRGNFSHPLFALGCGCDY